MIDDHLRREIKAATDAAARASGFARAALIIAAIALAVGVLGLGLPLDVS